MYNRIGKVLNLCKKTCIHAETPNRRLEYIKLQAEDPMEEIGACPYAVLMDTFKQEDARDVQDQDSSTSDSDSGIHLQ